MCKLYMRHIALCLPQQEAMQTAWSTVEVRCRLHDLLYTSVLSYLLLLRWLFERQAGEAGEHVEGGT